MATPHGTSKRTSFNHAGAAYGAVGAKVLKPLQIRKNYMAVAHWVQNSMELTKQWILRRMLRCCHLSTFNFMPTPLQRECLRTLRRVQRAWLTERAFFSTDQALPAELVVHFTLRASTSMKAPPSGSLRCVGSFPSKSTGNFNPTTPKLQRYADGREPTGVNTENHGMGLHRER